MAGHRRRFTVYLAGAMGGRPGQEVIEERIRAIAACVCVGLDYIDPAANEQVPKDMTPIALQFSYGDMKNFVAKDEYAISQCDALLVLTGDRASDGTSWEMGLAHFKLGIPVVMVAPKRASGQLMGFSNVKADAIFATVGEAVEFIAKNYARAKREVEPYAIH